MRCGLLAFAVGVLVLQQQPELPRLVWNAVIAAPLSVALIGALLARRASAPAQRIARAAAIAAAIAAVGLAGFFYAAWRAEMRLADELPSSWEGRTLELIGVVDELPHTGDLGTRFAFAVERVLTENAVVPSRLSLAWYAARDGDEREAVPPLHAGERWQLVARLKRPHGTANPHGFDLEAWLLENDLRATGYVRQDDANRRLDALAGRPGDYVERLRESIRERLLASLAGRPYAGVVAALAIGDERAIPAAQWQLFNRTGVGHLISISGLHVTFFATLIGAVVFWLWRRSHRLTLRLPARKAAAAAGVLAAFAYVLLAGFQVPAQRTLYMLGVAAIGLWIGRPGTASVVWLWALAVVLALDPRAMLAPGFWLSFSAVGVLLYTSVGRIGMSSGLRAAGRAQWAVTLGLVPLMLMLFQQVSLVSPLANAVAIPVVTFIVVPLTLASIVLPWDALLIAAHAVFGWLAAFLEYLSALPSAVWQQHSPPAWAVAAGALGVLWLLAPRGVPGRALRAVWLAPLFVVAPLPPLPGADRCIAGERWNWDGVEFAILHPVAANYANPKLKANDLSCVLRVSSPAGSALLTGDIEARTEADLIRREDMALRADLLVVPHHGSRTSSTTAFIAAVSPRVAVFTPGYRNRFGHPRPEIVERYDKAGIRSVRTDYEGALSFAFEAGAALRPVGQRDLDRRYWYDAPVRGALPALD
jgi:competence protein ComEC